VIINGGSRAGAQSLATHLLNQNKNERVEVLDVRGCLSTDLRGALVEMEESAEATRCQKALYHANIDPDRNVRMTAEQWQWSIDALEEKLGLQDHARAVVMHVKHGREHIHVVWNRIDLETMRTARDSHNYRKHELVSRELEREFGHERVQGAHIEREDQPRPERTAPKWAMQQGERLKLDPRQVKVQVQALWEVSDSGRGFAAALNDKGFALAKGDRRDFMVIDLAGGAHSLGRCVGAKAAELRSRMADVNREALPTVDQAVAITRERQAVERTTSREAVGKEIIVTAGELTRRRPELIIAQPPPLPQRPEKKFDETTLEIQRAYAASPDGRSFSAALDEHGIQLATVTAKDAARNPGYRAGDVLAINNQGQIYELDRHTAGAERKEVEKILSTLDRNKLQGIEATQEQIALKVAQFIALTQAGVFNHAQQKEPERDSLPSSDSPAQEKIDFRRYIEDREYRREMQRREREKPPPQRERGGLER
jgi:hypothetical protein